MFLAGHYQKKEFGDTVGTWDASPREKKKAWPMGKLEGGKDQDTICTGAELDQMERKNLF